MAKLPKHDFNLSLKTIFNAAAKIGVDGCLYLVVALGAFTALTAHANPFYVSLVTGFLLGGWLINKIGTAILIERKGRLELDRLKVIEGQALLEIHADRQRRLALDEESVD